MKALTIRQPWAHLIAAGTKDVENRVQGTAYRGPLAIHVAQAWDYDAFDQHQVTGALGVAGRTLRERLERTDDVRARLTETTGQVIAVVDLLDCHVSDGRCCSSWGWWHAPGPGPSRLLRHLVLANPRRLTVPFGMKGRLGLWDIDDQQIAAAS